MGTADKYLIKILGIVLVIIGIWYFCKGNEMRIRPTPRNAILVGLISGVLAGFFASGGPPMAIYYSSLDLEKKSYVGTLQCYFTFSTGYCVICRIISGAFTMEAVPYGIVGIIALFVGSWLGIRLLDKVSLEIVRKLVYIFVIISGVSLIF